MHTVGPRSWGVGTSGYRCLWEAGRLSSSIGWSLRLTPICLTQIPMEVWLLNPLQTLPLLWHQDSAHFDFCLQLQAGPRQLKEWLINILEHQLTKTSWLFSFCLLRVMVTWLSSVGRCSWKGFSPSFIGLWHSLHLHHVSLMWISTRTCPGPALGANLFLPPDKARVNALPGH